MTALDSLQDPFYHFNFDQLEGIDFSAVDFAGIFDNIPLNDEVPNNAHNAPSLQSSPDIALFDNAQELSDDEHSSSSSEQRQAGGKAPRAKYTHSLSPEDISLLRDEGYAIPDGALSKEQEKVLRQLRRKVKNKRLAASTRNKKKEYVLGLEERIEMCSTENKTLSRKVLSLENENRSLLQQLMDLRRSLGQPASLMVLALAFSCVLTSVPSTGHNSYNSTVPTRFASEIPQFSSTLSWLAQPFSWIAELDEVPVTSGHDVAMGLRPMYRNGRTL
jgi:hypothetical protein